jgi:L-alanine-DL-glutamate epimerase-like enolase superfamily enzyme
MLETKGTSSHVRLRRSSRISKVTAYPFDIPFVQPEGATEQRAYRWGFGVTPSISGAFVRVETDDGLVGWGESSMIFHPRQPATIMVALLEAIGQQVVGANPFDAERITAGLHSQHGWHFHRDLAHYAIGGLDIALYDLIGHASGLSVSELLGGRVRDEVPFMYFLYWDEIDSTIAEAQAAVADGFTSLYIKVGVEAPGEEVERIRAVRAAVGDRVQIRVDANERWSPGMAVRVIKQLEDLDLEFVEQPVLAQDIEGLATVRQRCRTPIAADQSSRTTHQLLRVIQANAADIVSSDPGGAGGIGAARRSAAIAEAAGLPFVVHSNVEAGIGTAAAVHLAAACVNCTYANQTEYQFAAQDVLDQRLALRQGAIAVPDGPGLGATVNEDAVAALAEEFRRSSVHDETSGENDLGGGEWFLPDY